MKNLRSRANECSGRAPSPEFFLIGAAKCGTTSVANYLGQHPEVFVSTPKEPNFFAFEPNSKPTCKGPIGSDVLYEKLLKYSVTSPGAYRNLFADAAGAQAIGEASVRYLYSADAGRRIADATPDAKLIAILRDPVDRMYSHYHMNVRKQIEPLSFSDAVDAEDERVAQGWGWDWHYRRVSEYGAQLQRFFDVFDARQLLVFWHSDLAAGPASVLRAIFQYLSVDADFQPDFSRRSLVGYTPKWRRLRNVVREDNFIKTIAKRSIPKRVRAKVAGWIEQGNRTTIPKLGRDMRNMLRARFADDTTLLETLLGKRVPW